MSVPAETIEIVRLWVTKAENDMAVVRLALPNGPYDAVCFHAQQAIEKYLKALLTLFGIPAPRTHDADRLLLLLPEGARPALAGDLSAISSYAVDVRYFAMPDATREQACEAARLAESVRDQVRLMLPPEAVGSV